MELHDRCPECLYGILELAQPDEIWIEKHLRCDKCCAEWALDDQTVEEGTCDCEFCKGLPDGSYGTMLLKKILAEVERMSAEDYNELFEKVHQLNEKRRTK